MTSNTTTETGTAADRERAMVGVLRSEHHPCDICDGESEFWVTSVDQSGGAYTEAVSFACPAHLVDAVRMANHIELRYDLATAARAIGIPEQYVDRAVAVCLKAAEQLRTGA